MSLNARLSVDINSEEFEQELVKVLETKMRHTAQQCALDAISDALKTQLQAYVEKAVEKKLANMSYADDCRVRDIIRTKVEQWLRAMDVKPLIEAEVRSQIAMLNIPAMIKTEIQTQTSAMAMETIKNALSGVFKTE